MPAFPFLRVLSCFIFAPLPLLSFRKSLLRRDSAFAHRCKGIDTAHYDVGQSYLLLQYYDSHNQSDVFDTPNTSHLFKDQNTSRKVGGPGVIGFPSCLQLHLLDRPIEERATVVAFA